MQIIQPVNSPSHSKVHLISLGCARNRVDSEVMLGGLLTKGWQIVQEPQEADVIIVNTCGFIEAAKEESVDTILRSAEMKKENPSMKLVVAGCLTQRYKTRLAQGLPEVDFFVGTDEFVKIPELLLNPPKKGTVLAKRTNYLYNEYLPRINTLTKRSAYVKVAEGCQHNCAFCSIPAIRGRLRSRPIESVFSEINSLAESGVIEVNLIAQDLAAYGRDRGEDELLPLLRRLSSVEKLQWLRLLYVYPEHIRDEFLELLASERKIVKYLDIPMQHGSDRILKLMNRNVTREELRAIISKVRQAVPNIAIRTSMMVGFPHENEEDFKELKGFVEEMEFDHLGCFSYSQEDGTVAGRMKEQIPEEVKAERLHEIMLLQKKISEKKLQKYVGNSYEVLWEGRCKEDPAFWQGRISTQAPEVDGVVLLPVEQGQDQSIFLQGSLSMAKILRADEYDLHAELLPVH